MKPIVTLTVNPSIDGSAQTDVVRPVRKIHTSDEHYDPGGGGLNVARVVQELGGTALAIYLAGGVTAAVLDELLTSARIAHRRVPIQEHTRISHAVYERSSGLQYRFVPEGPLVRDAEWQALPRGVPNDFMPGFSTSRRGGGAKLVLDTSGEALRAALNRGGVHLTKPASASSRRSSGDPCPRRPPWRRRPARWCNPARSNSSPSPWDATARFW
jgi:6-phosphofructokinase 2